LDNVISKWILDEVKRVEDDFSNELKSLGRGGVIDRSLENTASVSVSCDFDKVGGNSVVDELVVLGHELVETFLDYLIG
jgi:hypothetical protein